MRTILQRTNLICEFFAQFGPHPYESKLSKSPVQLSLYYLYSVKKFPSMRWREDRKGGRELFHRGDSLRSEQCNKIERYWSSSEGSKQNHRELPRVSKSPNLQIPRISNSSLVGTAIAQNGLNSSHQKRTDSTMNFTVTENLISVL